MKMPKLNKQNLKKRLSGLTILEMLVYIGIFGILITSVMGFALTLQQSQNKASASTYVEQNAIFLFEHFESTIPKAITIDEAQSIFNSDAGKIHFTLSGNIGEYTISNGAIYFNDGTSNTLITTQNVNVSKFRIEPRYYKDAKLTGIYLSITINEKQYETTFTIQ